MLSKKEINAICDTFYSINPNPKIELRYVNNFTLLVAIVLSAQSTDKMVNRCTEPLFKVCTRPIDVINMGPGKFMDYVKYIGMYRNKTKHVTRLSQILLSDYGGEVPDELEDLVRLPGVGNKTANVFLNTAFGKPTIGVDRHIFRIVHKIGITSGRDPDEISANLAKITPKKYHKQIHHWLVLHGRYICKAQKQLCGECPISGYCEHYQRSKSKLVD